MPSHDEIAQRAQQLWNERGRPHGQDDAIWLEAEKQLAGKSESKSALMERVKSETAAESVVENHLPATMPDEDAIKAALQKQTARAPQTPHHTGPKNKPAPPGKPLYDKPHSS
jgi:SMC interacting uncharacterized protein involved in chromosome segregation